MKGHDLSTSVAVELARNGDGIRDSLEEGVGRKHDLEPALPDEIHDVEHATASLDLRPVLGIENCVQTGGQNPSPLVATHEGAEGAVNVKFTGGMTMAAAYASAPSAPLTERPIPKGLVA